MTGPLILLFTAGGAQVQGRLCFSQVLSGRATSPAVSSPPAPLPPEPEDGLLWAVWSPEERLQDNSWGLRKSFSLYAKHSLSFITISHREKHMKYLGIKCTHFRSSTLRLFLTNNGSRSKRFRHHSVREPS